MKISHNWLQRYFAKPLPDAGKLAELFTFHSFEVEGIEDKDLMEVANDGKTHIIKDSILDVKVLPDRAHYALSHWGVAEEVSVLTRMPLLLGERASIAPELSQKPAIRIENPQFCRRYVGRYIEVVVEPSYLWVETFLTAVGQRAINSIVDATNYVMLDTGQPLHAFDADKIKGSIVIRAAKPGEKITLLDGREVELVPADGVIADDEGPLAIAGVKGGKRAEVTMDTRRIILESANFEPSAIRLTSTRLGLRNESSKRFENEITPDLAGYGMDSICSFIAKLIPAAKFGPVADEYPVKAVQRTILFDPAMIRSRLGADIPLDQARDILESMNITVDKVTGKVTGDFDQEMWNLTIPLRRLDLELPEEIVEEIGRVYGYDRITPVLPNSASIPPAVEKSFYYAEKIKNILLGFGFSEVQTYSLVSSGYFELEKSVASDKNFLRTNLSDGIFASLGFNARNADLLGLSEIRIFEIGKIFSREGEHTSLAIGVNNLNKGKKGKKAKDEIKEVRDNLLKVIDAGARILCAVDDTGGLISVGGQVIARAHT